MLFLLSDWGSEKLAWIWLTYRAGRNGALLGQFRKQAG